MKVEHLEPVFGTVRSAIVDNLEATQAALKKAGVEIIVPITE